jgi:hypothetical protein
MRFRRSLAAMLIVTLALFTSPAGAAWDKTKPPTNGPLVSADIRSNWTAIETAIGGANQIGDPTFLVWAAGDAAAPTMWTLAGAGSSVARTGPASATRIGRWAPSRRRSRPGAAPWPRSCSSS